jgi:hypothetical protein
MDPTRNAIVDSHREIVKESNSSVPLYRSTEALGTCISESHRLGADKEKEKIGQHDRYVRSSGSARSIEAQIFPKGSQRENRRGGYICAIRNNRA